MLYRYAQIYARFHGSSILPVQPGQPGQVSISEPLDAVANETRSWWRSLTAAMRGLDDRMVFFFGREHS